MDFLEKVLNFLNIFLFRITRGTLGSKLMGQDVLLLKTIGRKTGKTHTNPVNFFREQGDYLVVASNWGKDQHPGWYYNLLHQPESTIQVKNRTLRVQARPVPDADYDRLWDMVSGKNKFYAQYKSYTHRKIPIVILSEIQNGAGH